MITKVYKFRIYPNKQQEILIRKTFGSVRFIYNYFLSKKKGLYETQKQSMNFVECSRKLTELKSQEEYSWLKEVDKWALQNTLKDLDFAYQRFFKEKKGYPKFKSKKNNRKTYKTTYTNNNIEYLVIK